MTDVSRTCLEAIFRVKFYPQFWNKNGWYGMNNSNCPHKKTPVEMRGPGTSKHCVTNMAADEEATIESLSRYVTLLRYQKTLF